MRINFDSRAIEQQTDIHDVPPNVACKLVGTNLKQPADGTVPYVPDSIVDSQPIQHLHPGEWLTSSAQKLPASVFANIMTKSAAAVLVMFPAPQKQFCIGHVRGLNDLQRMLMNVKPILANGTNAQIVIMVSEGSQANMFNAYSAAAAGDGSEMNRILNEYVAEIEVWMGDKADKCTILGWIADWSRFYVVLENSNPNAIGTIGHCKDISTIAVEHDQGRSWDEAKEKDEDKDRDNDKDRDRTKDKDKERDKRK